MEQHSDSIKDFVMKSKLRLQKILKRLDWSEEGVLQNFNSNSVASSTLNKPKKIYAPKTVTYPESFVTTNSLTIETPELQQLLKNDQLEAPQNFRELQANFSREQKLQIYEHVISHTDKLENNTVPKVVDGEISLAEIVAQKKREEKRKKRKFRKSKPTHIEEVRSLVDLQMQALLQFINNQNENNLEKMTKDRSKTRSRDDHKSNTVKYKDGIESQRQQRCDDSRRRSKERFIERPIRSTERNNKKRSRSKSYDHRKRGQSREMNKDHKSYFIEETESYQRYRRKDYECSHRKRSKSPQATSSKVNQSKDRHHGSSSSHTRSIYDDYDIDRKKYKQASKSREKEKYSKLERVDKHKPKKRKSSYRHRSRERCDGHRSEHERKH